MDPFFIITADAPDTSGTTSCLPPHPQLQSKEATMTDRISTTQRRDDVKNQLVTDGGYPDPTDEIAVPDDPAEITRVETTLQMPAKITGEEKGEPVNVGVRFFVGPNQFYGDGRLQASAVAAIPETEEPPTTLREGVRPTESLSYKGELSSDTFEYNWLRIEGQEATTVQAYERRLGDVLTTTRDQLQNGQDMNVVVENRWKSGQGETHAIHAAGKVSFDDGRELGVKWRNAVDIGHQVFVREDGDMGTDRSEFSDVEIDAAVALAQAESPITKRMRMFGP